MFIISSGRFVKMTSQIWLNFEFLVALKLSGLWTVKSFLQIIRMKLWTPISYLIFRIKLQLMDSSGTSNYLYNRHHLDEIYLCYVICEWCLKWFPMLGNTTTKPWFMAYLNKIFCIAELEHLCVLWNTMFCFGALHFSSILFGVFGGFCCNNS